MHCPSTLPPILNIDTKRHTNMSFFSLSLKIKLGKRLRYKLIPTHYNGKGDLNGFSI